jgi:hypothetical protein
MYTQLSSHPPCCGNRVWAQKPAQSLHLGEYMTPNHRGFENSTIARSHRSLKDNEAM